MGYAATTVDAIAEGAGISGVTVYNYFGSKSGVLLALVIENESRLFEEIEHGLDAAPDDMVEIVVRFARALRRHAISDLDRVLWRKVFAASLVDGDTRFLTDESLEEAAIENELRRLMLALAGEGEPLRRGAGARPIRAAPA